MANSDLFELSDSCVSTTKDGLTIFYDENTFTFGFDWNSKEHPEYNFISELSAQELMTIFKQRLETIENNNADKSET
jgi:hypothetical protein